MFGSKPPGNAYIQVHTKDFLLRTTLGQESAYQVRETLLSGFLYKEKEAEVLEM